MNRTNGHLLVNLGQARFHLEFLNGRVVDAPDIAYYVIGWPPGRAIRWFQDQGATVTITFYEPAK